MTCAGCCGAGFEGPAPAAELAGAGSGTAAEVEGQMTTRRDLRGDGAAAQTIWPKLAGSSRLASTKAATKPRATVISPHNVSRRDLERMEEWGMLPGGGRHGGRALCFTGLC